MCRRKAIVLKTIGACNSIRYSNHTMNKTDKKYNAPALEKGLDIIELLAGEEYGLGLSDMARAMNRSVGEIFRMLMVLEHRGYVSQDPLSNRYMLTTLLFETAHRMPSVRRLTAIAVPWMREFAAESRQSVHMSVLGNGTVLVVGQVDSPENNVMSVRLGATIELYKASSARVLLAFMSDTELTETLSNWPLPKGIKKAAFLAELRELRSTGIEIRDSFIVRGVVNISVPLLDHAGEAVAAMTVPFVQRYEDELSIDQCVEVLLDKTTHINRALGYQLAVDIPDLQS